MGRRGDGPRSTSTFTEPPISKRDPGQPVTQFLFYFYELTYLPFFVAIEFVFRGYLLFGLESITPGDVRSGSWAAAAPYFFGKNALLIQMLSYTAWHLGKPLPELWGTIVWGIAAGATAWAVRSIWPVVLSHWLLNVFRISWSSTEADSKPRVPLANSARHTSSPEWIQKGRRSYVGKKGALRSLSTSETGLCGRAEPNPVRFGYL